MSALICSLRGHFYKHLAYAQPITAVFSLRRRVHRLIELPSNISPVWSEKSDLKRYIRSRSLPSSRSSKVTPTNATVSGSESPTSSYLSVRICCPAHVSELFSEALMCFGASSTTINLEDVDDSVKEMWITSVFNLSQDVRECISCAANSVGLSEILDYEIEVHDHTDWIKKSLESFHPVKISEGIWIVPEWMNPPDPGAINIILNPGLAFGTGEHPTTKLCLLLLHQAIKGGESFLDYGTGSGVLAIAAQKFGANLSVGFDIEPQAITSARNNAALNNIGPDKFLLSLVPGKNISDNENEFQNKDCAYNSEIIAGKDKYDVVIANILLYPLLDLADLIVSYARPGAIIGLSGVISEQVPSVTKHYSQFLEDINVSMMDDWACISGFKRKGKSVHQLENISSS